LSTDPIVFTRPRVFCDISNILVAGWWCKAVQLDLEASRQVGSRANAARAEVEATMQVCAEDRDRCKADAAKAKDALAAAEARIKALEAEATAGKEAAKTAVDQAAKQATDQSKADLAKLSAALDKAKADEEGARKAAKDAEESAKKLQAQVEDTHDVGVRQLRGEPRLLQEHDQELFLLAELRQEPLDDQPLVLAPGLGRRGEVDLRHPALGEPAEQPVRAEAEPGWRRSGHAGRGSLRGSTLLCHGSRVAPRTVRTPIPVRHLYGIGPLQFWVGSSVLQIRTATHGSALTEQVSPDFVQAAPTCCVVQVPAAQPPSGAGGR